MGSTPRPAMHEQRASVLMLMPAAALVFLVPGALCFDFEGTFSAKRELSNAAAAAAIDVASSQAIDLDRFPGSGRAAPPSRCHPVGGERSVAALGLGRLEAVEAVEEVVVGPEGRTVTVTLRGRARCLFAKAVPGGSDGMDTQCDGHFKRDIPVRRHH
jgi:hypothetical protein